MEKPSMPTPTGPAESTDDTGRVRLGGGFRLPAPVPAEIADHGRVRVGGGFRLPAEHC